MSGSLFSETLEPRVRIHAQGWITAIEQVSPNEKDFAVTIDCGKPFKQVLSHGFVGATVLDEKFKSEPKRGLLILRVAGKPTTKVGDPVPVEIEPTP